MHCPMLSLVHRRCAGRLTLWLLWDFLALSLRSATFYYGQWRHDTAPMLESLLVMSRADSLFYVFSTNSKRLRNVPRRLNWLLSRRFRQGWQRLVCMLCVKVLMYRLIAVAVAFIISLRSIRLVRSILLRCRVSRVMTAEWCWHSRDVATRTTTTG